MRKLGEMGSVGFGGVRVRGGGGLPLVGLLPVGSVEPHGPHLPLGTDSLISEAACEAAEAGLSRFCVPVRAPTVPYGVTECARGFAGAVSVPGEVLTAYLRAVIGGLLGEGFVFICVVNNHLEPAHDAAVRAAVTGMAAGVACPLSRRWGRTLSAEFKHGSCHAGRYESSLILASDPGLVDMEAMRGLPAVPISLAEKLRAGIADFQTMGLDRAYAGSPAEATAEEGRELLGKLAEMIVAEVREGLERVERERGEREKVGARAAGQEGGR